MRGSELLCGSYRFALVTCLVSHRHLVGKRPFRRRGRAGYITFGPPQYDSFSHSGRFMLPGH